MYYKNKYLTVILILISVYSINLVPICLASDTVIRITTPTTPINMNDQFTLIVKVENVESLWGWKIALKWDPEIFEYISAEEGPMLKQGSTTIFVSRSPNQQLGEQSEIACTILGTTSASGNGEIVQIKFKAKKNTTNSEIQFTKTEMRKPTLPDHPAIPHQAIDVLVNVGSDGGNQTPPEARAGDDKTIKRGETLVLDGSKSQGTNLRYSWTFTDGQIQNLTGMKPTYIFKQTGVYEITLSVRNNIGVADSDKVKITVNEPEPPKAIIKIKTLSAKAQSGIQLTLNATESSGSPGKQIIKYEWDLGDGVKFYEPIVRHSYREPGQYKVTLKIEDSEGLFGNAETSIDVEENIKTIYELQLPQILILVIVSCITVYSAVKIITKEN